MALVLAIETLAKYADPTSYHAIAFLSDKPAGWFADDVSRDKKYGRWMPGAEARKTLTRIQKLIPPNAKDTNYEQRNRQSNNT